MSLMLPPPRSRAEGCRFFGRRPLQAIPPACRAACVCSTASGSGMMRATRHPLSVTTSVTPLLTCSRQSPRFASSSAMATCRSRFPSSVLWCGFLVIESSSVWFGLPFVSRSLLRLRVRLRPPLPCRTTVRSGPRRRCRRSRGCASRDRASRPCASDCGSPAALDVPFVDPDEAFQLTSSPNRATTTWPLSALVVDGWPQCPFLEARLDMLSPRTVSR